MKERVIFVRVPYSENSKMQIFISSAFFNLMNEYSFADVRDVFRLPTVRNINDFYTAFVAQHANNAAEREKIWQIFDNGYVAFENTPPRVRLERRPGNPNANPPVRGIYQLVIDENVAVSRIEWYADNGTTPIHQGSDSYVNINLPARTRLTVRVYDPAGVATEVALAAGDQARLPAGRTALFGEQSIIVQ